ncbi:MAG: Lrp/AsnC family transcriptional regulator [Sphingorhabdus sp.]|uniref:Lrp/AsnC family transcriptional regulator n=1 Tax=Sphingorhabdus sp. TaxID=1902408 RepID=UPI003CA96039
MDFIDRQIIELLRRDARLPLKTIAGTVGLARSSVRSRIARLEAEELITGYRAQVALEKAGGAAAIVSIELASTPMPDVIAAIVGDPAVDRCYSLAGEIDLLVEISDVSCAGLNAARDRLSVIPGVVRAKTSLILKRDKAG